MTGQALLDIENLTVTYATRSGQLRALDTISLSVAPGETLAVVGESGSGKSTVALATMGLLGPEAAVSGKIQFAGRDLTRLPGKELRKMRGRDISIVFQDPFTSLNPSLRIGLQVAESLIEHLGLGREEALERAAHALAGAGLPNAQTLISAYPHQLSGGMQQRVLIATALVCGPRFLILDEPTTALDVTVEAHIIELLQNIKTARQLGMLFITHNLGVVNQVADRVCVIYAGRIVEIGPKAAVLGSPAHPYTKGLLSSLPRLEERTRRLAPIGGRFPDLMALPEGCAFAPRCPFAEDRCREPQKLVRTGDDQSALCWKASQLRHTAWPGGAPETSQAPRPDRAGGTLSAHNLSKTYTLPGGGKLRWRRRFGLPWPGIQRRSLRAVGPVSFYLGAGEVLGLVGESGSGKSTLARLVLRLIEPASGTAVFNGADVYRLHGAALMTFRQLAQIVFQNPDSSLNPRRTVGEAVARALKLHSSIPRSRRRPHVEDLIGRVGLPGSYYDRYPHQLSGGEKQRIGIARALATNPVLVVCDEPVSALDVSVQATVLNLLADLRDELNLSYLFISHDLSVVAHIADRIAVMYAGRIVETGPTSAVLQPPHHPYTEALLAAIPHIAPARTAQRGASIKPDVTAARSESGCPFSTRCPRKLGEVCETVDPPLQEAAPLHSILCHIPLKDLRQVPPPFTASEANRA